MGQLIITVDDITGEREADEVVFAWADRVYKIDLTKANREELAAALGPFMHFATDVGKLQIDEKKRRTPPTPRGPDSSRHTAEDTAALRAWATNLGVKLPNGRIPVAVWAAWRADDPKMLPPRYRPEGPTPTQQKLAEVLEQAS